MQKHQNNLQFGGVALEYIIISTFAAILSVAAITLVTKIFKQKVEDIENKLKIEIEDADVDPLSTD